MKNFYRSISNVLAAGLMALFPGTISAQAFTENFDDITTLAGNGWSLQNLSTPVGSTNWFQGTNVSAGGPFDAFNGAANAYIGANYNNTGNTGTISNWLMTPNRTLRNGDVLTFYTRKVSPDTYADRLEVRMSTNGASTNAADFTTLLMSINPNLVLGVYPTAWTQYTITVSGLSAPFSGRFAFRYFVTNAGLNGTNSDYIGIDNVVYTPYVCPTITLSPSTIPNGTAGVSYSQSLSQTGCLGSPTYALTAGTLPTGITLSPAGVLSGTPTSTGAFNFTITAMDASGCTGSRAYTIIIACPTGGATLSSIPPLCSNGGLYTLVEGNPSGGTYSGTGVSAGQFDPAFGSQTITYTLVDVYGCTQVANGNVVVNTAPTVTQPPFSAVCADAGLVTLSGGSPSGGTYSGTGVNAGTFDPASGTQPISYTYTDMNGCSNSDTQTLTVNALPAVSYTETQSTVCVTLNSVTLTAATPGGGTYSGTAVSGNTFDPSAAGPGTFSIIYSFTDVNGCTNSDTSQITVDLCLGTNEPTYISGVSCYPNPSSGTFTVQFVQSQVGMVSITIMGIDGKLIDTFEQSASAGTVTQQVNVNDLAKGTYLLRIQNSTSVLHSRITIQ
jgi:hypothetical protein